VLRNTFQPHRVLLAVEEGEALATLATLAPIVAGKTTAAGQAQAFVCKQGACDLPVLEPRQLSDKLLKF